MDYQFIDNSAEKRFEMHTEGFTAFITYQLNGDTITLTHTEVPEELGGKGIGSEVVKRTLETIDERSLSLIVLCPFVAAYIKKHPEWRKLLVKQRFSGK